MIILIDIVFVYEFVYVFVLQDIVVVAFVFVCLVLIVCFTCLYVHFVGHLHYICIHTHIFVAHTPYPLLRSQIST